MGEPSNKLDSVVKETECGVPETQAPALEDVRTFTFGQRLKIWAISVFGYLAVLFIGRSLRWEVYGRENYEEARRLGKSFIVTFWHCQIFPAIWYWRKRGMVVMVSQNFDGEYTTKVIHGHGYATARGSSSRRGSRAAAEIIRALREGLEAAITPDGPRGPRFVAQPGVVQIAKRSGAAILCFHITPRHSWVFRKSWDQTEIPKPFSRTAIFIAPPIFVSVDADEEQQARKLREVQETLDGLVQQGNAWLGAETKASTQSSQK